MKQLALFVVTLLLFGCGGSSSSSSSSSPASMTISGVAAAGAAISGRIYLKDAASHEVFVDTQDGTFSFNAASLTPPFMLKAEWTGGGVTQKLYSFVASVGTANITPLTHMAVLSAAGVSDLSPVYSAAGSASFATIATNLPGVIADLRTSLKPLLDQYSADMDPISGVFAANHAGIDQLFDDVSFSYAPGAVAIKSKASDALLFNLSTTNLSQDLTALTWTNQDALIANDPDVAVDADGKGLVVWSESDGTRYNIRAKWLGEGESATRVSNGTGDASFPRVAFDASGNAVVVWAQDDAGRNNIWATRYVVGSGWGTPVQIETNDAGDAGYPQVAVDAAGNAFAVWHQSDGVSFHIWTNRYTAAGSGWGTATMLSSPTLDAARPHVAVTPDGTAFGMGAVADRGRDDV